MILKYNETENILNALFKCLHETELFQVLRKTFIVIHSRCILNVQHAA